MSRKTTRWLTPVLCALVALVAVAQSGQTQFKPEIPKTWDDEAMASFELPLAEAKASPLHVTAEYYYRLPEHVIYKSYPVYAPGKEPAGYFEQLTQREPEVIFDAAKLHTEADWIKAGELVFDAPIAYDAILQVSDARDPLLYEKVKLPLARDGTVPALRYVIREKGKVELSNVSCGMCHTRVLPDGAVVKGAQGNYPFDPVLAYTFYDKAPLEQARSLNRQLVAAPWVKDNPQARLDQITREELVAAFAAPPHGVVVRQGTSVFHPPQVPDLIGVKDRRYLDSTGLNRHRSIGDLMRYAALNQTMDMLNRYGNFIPVGNQSGALPPPGQAQFIGTSIRYSEAQLYALALYLYSLKPPPNPNKFDDLAARGQQVFQREGCTGCHTPPLYTNNKLTPADGFKIPAEHKQQYDILPLSVGTDPNLTLTTRRGTGYYKVPSLKGVWYRGPFEHNGSVATLEDWFDPHRLRDDYVPTGFKGYGVKTRAVKGHEFGLELSVEDRRALIAFLKTL